MKISPDTEEFFCQSGAVVVMIQVDGKLITLSEQFQKRNILDTIETGRISQDAILYVYMPVDRHSKSLTVYFYKNKTV